MARDAGSKLASRTDAAFIVGSCTMYSLGIISPEVAAWIPIARAAKERMAENIL